MENWARTLPAAITITDATGTILEMNERAIESFAADGGIKLLGANLLECHPEPARSKLSEMLRTGTGNVYTIEKGGAKKLIFQSPWYEAGEYRGLVEISVPLPSILPHFIRS